MKTTKEAKMTTNTDEEIRRHIGNRIKTLRQSKLRLSAEMVAKRLKISRTSLTEMENGKTNISTVMIWKIACLFDTQVDNFFPQIPTGFGLSKTDLRNIANEDEQAVAWGIDLFGENKNE